MLCSTSIRSYCNGQALNEHLPRTTRYYVYCLLLIRNKQALLFQCPQLQLSHDQSIQKYQSNPNSNPKSRYLGPFDIQPSPLRPSPSLNPKSRYLGPNLNPNPNSSPFSLGDQQPHFTFQKSVLPLSCGGVQKRDPKIRRCSISKKVQENLSSFQSLCKRVHPLSILNETPTSRTPTKLPSTLKPIPFNPIEHSKLAAPLDPSTDHLNLHSNPLHLHLHHHRTSPINSNLHNFTTSPSLQVLSLDHFNLKTVNLASPTRLLLLQPYSNPKK